jgi:transposase-like protein
MGEPISNVVQIDRVRCLACGAKYVKPVGGGTVHENPGCPKCGYVGWISTRLPASHSGGRRF